MERIVVTDWDVIMKNGPHGEEWRKCLADGRCWITQNTYFNPYDGRGLDLICLVHDFTMNIPVEYGQREVERPSVCPKGQKAKLN